MDPPARDPRPLVLHVIHHLRMGGMENGLVNLINEMPESSFRHAIACVEDASDFRLRIRRDDVRVEALHRSRIGVWALRHRLYRLCRGWRPTIVHSRNLSGLDALLPARLAGVPHTVHGEHGWDVDDIDGRRWRPAALRRLHAPLVERYVAVSSDIERYLRSRIGIAARRISQIYNGVDTLRFAPSQRRPPNIPAALADPDRVWIGTAGRLQAVKDQATLLTATATALAAEPGLRSRIALALFGGGPLEGSLREQALGLGIADITWFAGATDDMPAALGLLDVFVLPSLNEGISNTILEAMSCALPVIATRTGGNPELVDDPHTGWLFSPRDVAMLAQLLVRCVGDPALRIRSGQAARARVLERFSLRAMVSAYGDVYSELVQRRRSR